ncbi:ESX-1 secretion system protein EccE1 [Mycolicibacterium madagascariense]|uniref:ESX-1 secretion system protein EccE1 n=1 Tax=Mycolicibacterium madagascariense TaxID=212765 RepID=A0A7I7XPN2_9MYCO|nr:type VII secretion protein EccE [Mycolicibacterium madagascariense]MCV7014028.1 type VII secretion protein EccE [Mycolicibacterium madagascariense]BBZ31053.1 ESX-1 secretion system protein EccE1 [Mycolicibacterium madagascariense]
MTDPRPSFGVRVTTGHLASAAAVLPGLVVVLVDRHLSWLAVTSVVIGSLAITFTVRGRRATAWIAAVVAWRRRRGEPPAAASEPSIGTTVRPGDRVAVRWQGDRLVALVELVARPFTPTVIVAGAARTDDVVNTELVQRIVATFCPGLDADVVSAGYRVGRVAPPGLVALYEQVVGPAPAPAHRRTWIVVRAHPDEARRWALRRDTGVAGVARYLVASATRLADHLASSGVDARCADGFEEFDRATGIDFHREAWSYVRGRGSFTTAYTAAGGPDAWWSARSDHVVTRVRIRAGQAPRATVLLTTSTSPSTPQGFSCLHGGQRAALSGDCPTAGRHFELPIGSAGVLVGETANRCPVYLPFDDVDSCIELGDDARLFTQFVVRSAAAGAVVTLGPQFADFAGSINARIGTDPSIAWPRSTTYLGTRPDISRVTLRDGHIETPRHRRLPIRLVTPREESRYQMTLAHAEP